MLGFPAEANKGDLFPVTVEKRPGQFEATYLEAPEDKVTGLVIAETADGSGKREYLFEVNWRNGNADVTVTTADPSNKRPFWDRDSEMPFRALKGMSKKHRPDARDYAQKVAEHVRKRVFGEQDWLNKQFDSSAAIPIELDAKPRRPMRFAFLQGWLLEETDIAKGKRAHARFLGAEATLSDAKRKAEDIVARSR